MVEKRDARSSYGVLDVCHPVQQYWAKEAGPYKFMPAAEMAKAFENSKIGQAAAEELAQPPERTQQGILASCLCRLCSWNQSSSCLESGRIASGVQVRLLAGEGASSVCSNHMRCAGYDALVHKQYALSAWKSMKACMRREVILVYRHSFVYLFRIAQVRVSALVCQCAWSDCSRACSLHFQDRASV